jgi:hypothetical protein
MDANRLRAYIKRSADDNVSIPIATLDEISFYWDNNMYDAVIEQCKSIYSEKRKTKLRIHVV